MQEIFLPIAMMCGATMVFASIFGFFAFMRYLSHKETLAMVEKGLIKPEQITSYNGGDKRVVRWAIILIALGMALCFGLFPIGFWQSDPGILYLGPWMLPGLLPLFFGLALLVIYLLPALHTLARQGMTLIANSSQAATKRSETSTAHPTEDSTP